MEVRIMAEMDKLNVEALDGVAGGNDGMENWRTAEVTGSSCKPPHYLALRSAPSYNDANEIAKLYYGETLRVNRNNRSGSYIWAQAKGLAGWVNGDYITIY